MSVQTLYTAATGMEALQTKLDVIAHNLANVNTTGFKRGRANFEDLLYQEMPTGAVRGRRHPDQLAFCSFRWRRLTGIENLLLFLRQLNARQLLHDASQSAIFAKPKCTGVRVAKRRKRDASRTRHFHRIKSVRHPLIGG